MPSGIINLFSPHVIFRRLSRFNFRRRQECSTILRWLDARPGEAILDVGCGDGYYDALVSRTGARVLGIDIHPRMLPFAQKHYGDERTEFVFMDAEEMDLPGRAFDKVMSLCVVEHFTRDDMVLRHISRHLKPGGRFIFSADSLSNPGITDAERSRHRRRYSVNTFYTTRIIVAKLAGAGLAVERMQYILQRPLDLALARISWKLDDLPAWLGIIRFLGYFGLWAAQAISRPFSREDAAATGGLTLLVSARKV
jgi:SAM-dependent methyltransferase